MTKGQALQTFWQSFGLPAYDENTVPQTAVMPYITYSVQMGNLDSVLMLSGSVWYRSSSWKEIEEKTAEIAKAVGEHAFYKTKVDGGYLWITQGSPFAQRMSDTDDMIRRMYINLHGEFLTAY